MSVDGHECLTAVWAELYYFLQHARENKLECIDEPKDEAVSVYNNEGPYFKYRPQSLKCQRVQIKHCLNEPARNFT